VTTIVHLQDSADRTKTACGLPWPVEIHDAELTLCEACRTSSLTHDFLESEQ